jgi:hypothetical protein
MGAAGYWWERLCFATYAPFLLYTAAVNPSYFGHLTYWALTLHALYFTVDKASPHSAKLTLFLHGMSFGQTFVVLVGYINILIGGMYRWGSYLEWENQIGKRAGTVHHDRGLQELVIQKSFEHLWPVVATLVDVHLNKDSFARVLNGAPKLRTTVLSIASALAFGTVWEHTSKGTGKGSPLDVYVQPDALRTPALLAQMGIADPGGLPDDLIYTAVNKLILILVASFMYWKWVAPLTQPAKRATRSKGGKGS